MKRKAKKSRLNAQKQSRNQHKTTHKQYSKGEQLSLSAFAISRIPTCQKVSLWTKTEGFQAFFVSFNPRGKMGSLREGAVTAR